ncbi:MAG: DNA internalization-related competence protein ComEC/Rec2 [Rhodothermales bacterium]
MPVPVAGYPAAAASIAFASGIVAASCVPWDAGAWLTRLGLVAVLPGALWGLSRSIRPLNPDPGVITLIALIATLCAGAMRYTTFYAIPQNHDVLAFAAERESEWTGYVADPPTISRGSVRFTLRLKGNDSSLGILVSGRLPPGTRVSQCDAVRVRGRSARLPRPRNPGEFDYGSHLARQRIYLRVYLSDGGLTHIGRRRSGFICAAEPIRSIVRARLDRYVSEERPRAVLQALILGDRRGIDSGIRGQFARMGLLHLLAVSGLHVMVVGMVFYRVIGPSLKRMGFSWRSANRLRATSTALLLVGYMLLTGCTASVVRAVVMALLFLLSTVLQRPSRPINTLGLAVMLLLVVRPAHLYEAGFQLSVTAVAAILLITPQLQVWIPVPSGKVLRHVHGVTSVTVAATLGTLPVVLFHFGQVGLAGLLLNIPGIPLTTAALAAGIAAIVSGGSIEAAGLNMGSSATLLAQALLSVAELGDIYMPWSVVRLHIEDPTITAAIALIVVAISAGFAPAHRWRCLLAALTLWTLHLGTGIVRGDYRPHVDLVFFDVGQGDAILLRFPGGKNVLVDAGPRSIFTDAGARVILPQLTYHGVSRLSSVVITHPDSDHLGGLPTLLRSVPVDRVIQSDYQHTSALYLETESIVDSLGVPRQTVRSGDTLSFSQQAYVRVLHPPASYVKATPNEHSIVLAIRFGTVTALLMGDVPVEVEYDLLQRYGDLLRSDILKVGHHGSRTSSSAAFVAGVHPRKERGEGKILPYAVISVAESNRFGLPDEDVIDRLRRTDYRIAMTAESGAIWIRTDGRNVKQVDWRK